MYRIEKWENLRTRNKIKKSVDEGLEPPQQEPESRVLPLHQSTIK